VFPRTLIPPAEAGGESRPNLQNEILNFFEIPSTEVGGVSKVDLSTVRILKTRTNKQNLEARSPPVGYV
jgi:hypothetical protein